MNLLISRVQGGGSAFITGLESRTVNESARIVSVFFMVVFSIKGYLGGADKWESYILLFSKNSLTSLPSRIGFFDCLNINRLFVAFLIPFRPLTHWFAFFKVTFQFFLSIFIPPSPTPFYMAIYKVSF